MPLNLDITQYDEKNFVTIHLIISDLVDLDLLDTSKITRLVEANASAGFATPIIKRMIEESGAKCTIKATDGWRKYKINFTFFLLNTLYKIVGEEKYVELLNLEVPNG